MLRRLVLRALLIAVFLNTAIGVPLHAGVHLAAALVAQGDAQRTVEPGSPDQDQDQDHDHRAGTPCAWCLAQAEASSAPPPAFVARVAAVRPSRAIRPANEAGHAFSAGLWSSSPRGPPC